MAVGCGEAPGALWERQFLGAPTLLPSAPRERPGQPPRPCGEGESFTSPRANRGAIRAVCDRPGWLQLGPPQSPGSPARLASQRSPRREKENFSCLSSQLNRNTEYWVASNSHSRAAAAPGLSLAPTDSGDNTQTQHPPSQPVRSALFATHEQRPGAWGSVAGGLALPAVPHLLGVALHLDGGAVEAEGALQAGAGLLQHLLRAGSRVCEEQTRGCRGVGKPRPALPNTVAPTDGSATPVPTL